LLGRGIGPAASATTAAIAMMLTFGTMNAYLAGASRLGAALARDGALPSPLAKGHQPGQTPRRSLTLLFVLRILVSPCALVARVRLGGAAAAPPGAARSRRLLRRGHGGRPPRRTATAAPRQPHVVGRTTRNRSHEPRTRVLRLVPTPPAHPRRSRDHLVHAAHS